VGRASDSTRRAGEAGSFGVARERWLGGLGNVRNVVRQEIITRQLGKHLPDRPCRILDVGAGQGTQSRRLARAGHWVVAVEPDPEMRARLRAALRTDPADAGERVKVVAGSVGDPGSSIAADGYDVVLCLGVLMYLPGQPVGDHRTHETRRTWRAAVRRRPRTRLGGMAACGAPGLARRT
jgi:SAM-dependent methyltransferase